MIAVIKSCGNNLASLTNALQKLSCQFVVTDAKEVIETADKVILPGVGRAAPAMENLAKLDLIPTLQTLKQPVLGICLGMQLLYEFTQEDQVKCLGLIPGEIRKFSVVANSPVPHMGWNQLMPSSPTLLPLAGEGSINEQHELFNHLTAEKYVYFVHSFYAEINDYTIGTTKYSCEFTAAVQKNNFFGVQFHPEKSGDVGFRILKNFLDM